MIRLNILEQRRKKCECGGNCKCNTNTPKKQNNSMHDFFSAMKQNTEEWIKD